MAREESKRVRLLTSWASEGFSYPVESELEVHHDLAIALCTEPVDQPRAVPVGWELPVSDGETPAKREKPHKRVAPSSSSN